MQETFASYVATLRKSKGLTQKELASCLGFTPQGISRFESLDSSFDLRLIPKLCQSLDISFTELCARQKEGTHYVEFDLDLDNLCTRIKATREAKGITQGALSESAQITSRSLRSYESGDSLPSFQTLTRICECLGVSVISLFAKPNEEKEDPPASVSPSTRFHWWSHISKSAMIPVIAILIAIAVLGVGLPVGLSINSNRAQENIALDSGNQPPSDSRGTPYLPSSSKKRECPNYLSVDIASNDFASLGEEIEFVLYDPDANVSLAGIQEDEISLSYQGTYEQSSLDIEFDYKGNGKFGATLKSGKSGDMAWINARIGEGEYCPITYLRYVSGEEVIPSSGDPFDDGVVSGPTSISLSRQSKISADIYVTNDGNPVPFSGSIALVDREFPAMKNPYDQEVGVEVLGNELILSFPSPQDIVSDDVYLFVGVDIVEEEGNRLFYLSPWKLHLYH